MFPYNTIPYEIMVLREEPTVIAAEVCYFESIHLPPTKPKQYPFHIFMIKDKNVHGTLLQFERTKTIVL